MNKILRTPYAALSTPLPQSLEDAKGSSGPSQKELQELQKLQEAEAENMREQIADTIYVFQAFKTHHLRSTANVNFPQLMQEISDTKDSFFPEGKDSSRGKIALFFLDVLSRESYPALAMHKFNIALSDLPQFFHGGGELNKEITNQTFTPINLHKAKMGLLKECTELDGERGVNRPDGFLNALFVAFFNQPLPSPSTTASCAYWKPVVKTGVGLGGVGTGLYYSVDYGINNKWGGMKQAWQGTSDGFMNHWPVITATVVNVAAVLAFYLWCRHLRSTNKDLPSSNGVPNPNQVNQQEEEVPITIPLLNQGLLRG